MTSSQQYIRELMRLTPTAANVLKYAAIVRDQALLRNVISVCEETVEAASSGAGEAGDVLDLCEKKIYALRQDRVVGGLMPVSQVVNSVYSIFPSSPPPASNPRHPDRFPGRGPPHHGHEQGATLFLSPRAPAWAKRVSVSTSA